MKKRVILPTAIGVTAVAGWCAYKLSKGLREFVAASEDDDDDSIFVDEEEDNFPSSEFETENMDTEAAEEFGEDDATEAVEPEPEESSD